MSLVHATIEAGSGAIEAPSLRNPPPSGNQDGASPSGDSPPRTPSVPRRLHLQMPVNVRSAALAVIALILSLHALQWAQEIVVPILFGVMSSYALTPIVDRLQRLKIPRPAGAALVLTLIVALVGWGVWALREQADALIDTVPAVTVRIRDISQNASGRPSAIERVQKAAAELAAAAEAAPSSASASEGASAAARARLRLQAAAPASPGGSPSPAFDVRSYLLSGTLGVLSLLSKLAVIYFVALFLMSSGNNFRRKMVKIAGPTLGQKKVTIETLDEITRHIQQFLLVQLGVSVAVGVFTWLGFLALGLNNAGVWGVVAGVTNMIPYVGAVLVGAGAALVALVQFGTPGMALVVAATSFGIHTVLGNVLTPLWMGRASKMSPVAVFIAIIAFGWLWGVWGLLLGVPILLVVKSVCDRVEELKPIGELLGQ